MLTSQSTIARTLYVDWVEHLQSFDDNMDLNAKFLTKAWINNVELVNSGRREIIENLFSRLDSLLIAG